MKKILVTGASGTIGIRVVEKLLESDKYEITVLDLKNIKSLKRLKKYSNKINILYGDINDIRLVDALIRDHDAIIHLAGIIPPFADIKTNLAKVVDYGGTKTIINAINDFNPNCFLIYASTTTLYGENLVGEELSVKNKITVDPDDYYSMAKLRCEEEIKDNVKNYTIFRLPSVLGDIRDDAPMYNIPISSRIEFISANDAATAFVNAIEKKSKINKRTFNITGGDACRTIFRDFLYYVFSTYGLSIRYIATSLFVDKNFYSGYYSDGDDAEKILRFRNDSLSDIYLSIKQGYGGRRRFLSRLFTKPILWRYKRK